MRKIEKNMVAAIKARETVRCGDNTRVYRTSPSETASGVSDTRVLLHGSLIAVVPDDDTLPVRITLAGWDTVTTRSRINTIAREFCSASVHRVKGQTVVTRAGESEPLTGRNWAELIR